MDGWLVGCLNKHFFAFLLFFFTKRKLKKNFQNNCQHTHSIYQFIFFVFLISFCFFLFHQRHGAHLFLFPLHISLSSSVLFCLFMQNNKHHQNLWNTDLFWIIELKWIQFVKCKRDFLPQRSKKKKKIFQNFVFLLSEEKYPKDGSINVCVCDYDDNRE